MFDTEDEEGNWNERVKLIRNESIGSKSWDNSGINTWTDSYIKSFLNEEYVIDVNSAKIIDSIKYYIGGAESFQDGESIYNYGRGSQVRGDNINWTGKIGLMYPSDILFTYALGVNDDCYNNQNSCSTSYFGWLNYSNGRRWLISPRLPFINYVFLGIETGRVGYYETSKDYHIFPTLYLKPNVKIKSGDGTIDNPYEFEL